LANTKSAEKRNRQMQKRRARNAAIRTSVRAAVKRAREALLTKDPQKAREALQAAKQVIDTAKSKGVLHARNASRRIARLSKHVSGAFTNA
jgi:small subunit ribosomal protein S20